jgi:hypothetical protein
VPIRSPESIREKILFLYEHPDVRATMSAAAKRRVTAIGGWDRYGEQMTRVYETALAHL